MATFNYEEMLDYIKSNIDDFNERYYIALNKIDHYRCSLNNADYSLYNEILDRAQEWWNDYCNEDEDAMYNILADMFFGFEY